MSFAGVDHRELRLDLVCDFYCLIRLVALYDSMIDALDLIYLFHKQHYWGLHWHMDDVFADHHYNIY